MKCYVFALVAACCTTANPILAQDVQFQAVWHTGDGRSHQTGLLRLQQFIDEGAELVGNGLRLIDVETVLVSGQRRYSGLFTEGSGGNFIDFVQGRAALRDRMQQRAIEGLRIQDVEIFGPPNARRFVLVFGPGTGEQRVSRPRNFREFLEIKDLWRSLGLHLADVEVRRINGNLRYMGVFRSDVPPTVITGARSRARFVQLRNRMVGDGWELFDVERQVNRTGDDVYLGLWREGNSASALSRFRALPAYMSFAAAQEDAGQQAVDFEIKPRRDHNNPPDGFPIPNDDDRRPGQPLPDYITITSGPGTQRFRLEWSNDSDDPFHFEIPLAWLPDGVITDDGDVVFPEDFCQMSIRLADAYSWQVFSEPPLNDAFFNSDPNVPEGVALAGVHFEGPFGDCFNTQTPWLFEFPLTSENGPFEPLPNMSFVIEATDGELTFD